VRLRVSAGFKGLLKRLFSAEMLLNINRPPVADAGRDRDVAAGSDVEVDGRLSSDPDGDRLAYLWTLEERPAGSLANSTASTARGRCSSPTRPATTCSSWSSTTARSTARRPSFASTPARPMRHRPPMPEPTRTFPPARRYVSTGAAAATRRAPRSATPGNWSTNRRRARPRSTTRLRHTRLPRRPGRPLRAAPDGDRRQRHRSSPDEIVVTAYAANTPPTAVPGPDQSVAPGSRVDLDGSASFDPDPGRRHCPVRLELRRRAARQYGGAVAAIQVFPSPPLTSFVADLAGDYVIELVVTDQRGARSAPRRVLVQAGSPDSLKPALTRLVPEPAVAGSGPLVLAVEGLRFDPAASVVFGTTPLNTRFIMPRRSPPTCRRAARFARVLSRCWCATRRPPAAIPTVAVYRRAGDADPERRHALGAGSRQGRNAGLGGANFTPASKVRFGASTLATTFGSSTNLTALVPASLLTAPGTVPVTVVDPVTGTRTRST
jgi:hypothetical protein